jgi:hypothetical protein
LEFFDGERDGLVFERKACGFVDETRKSLRTKIQKGKKSGWCWIVMASLGICALDAYCALGLRNQKWKIALVGVGRYDTIPS